jgi:hypothetical protein
MSRRFRQFAVCIGSGHSTPCQLVHGRHLGVCTEKLNPDVVAMKSAKDRI